MDMRYIISNILSVVGALAVVAGAFFIGTVFGLFAIGLFSFAASYFIGKE
ncbi:MULTISPECIES: hypothetical protein [Weissella]|jgi:hypothetical protein|nr:MULTISPECIES: hypothetical protein [Weissella]MBJ7680638.1 hypothetical protein [Weissella confusa]